MGWSSTLQRLMKAVCQRGKKTTSVEPVENFASAEQVFSNDEFVGEKKQA